VEVAVFAEVATEERAELRGVVRAFLARHCTEEDVRRLMATRDGFDTARWARMGAELGLQGLAIPDRYGGAGFGYGELGVVFEEFGRALVCAPYFATVALAAEALLRADDETAAKDYLPGIAAGETVATLAMAEDTTSARYADGWRLTGEQTCVPDGRAADLVLVVARTDAGAGLFAVDAPAAGLSREALPTIDQTRKQARLRFDDVPARLVGEDGAASAILARTLDTAAVLLAAEQLGGAARALELAADYAKIREQYGRLIGSFQAVKHRLADMLVDVECARSAVHDGLRALMDDAPDLPVVAATAKAFCSEAYTRVSAGAIQVHGGIGFTWEHPAHLYFKRAKSSEILLGSPAWHRHRLAGLLGI
jgi:alkylation response protein AidB-like acyl-CoA dehydrogenase